MDAPGNGHADSGGQPLRGRGSRGGRGGQHRRAAEGPVQRTHKSHHITSAVNASRHESALGVEAVTIPRAFESSCGHVQRCHEHGHLLRLPLPHGLRVDFALVERAIGGMDDIIYRTHREVWERLPRGNARVFVRRTPDASYTLVGALNGLRKFGDSDCRYGYPDEVKTVVAVDQESAECGHVAAFVLPSDTPGLNALTNDGTATANRFWIVGSEVAHVVLDYHVTDACLDYYNALGQRYSQAVKMARLWKEMLPVANTTTAVTTNAGASRTLRAEQAMKLHDVLHTHKWTSCFEVAVPDNPHGVDDDGAGGLRFYAITTHARAFEGAPLAKSGVGVDEEEHPAATPSSSANPGAHCYSRIDGLCLPVDEAEVIYAGVGLPFARHSNSLVYNGEDFAKLVDTIHRRTHTIGCVMYGADGSGKVVRLWREKSYPFVMEHATREAVTNYRLAGKDLADAVKRKLKQQPPALQDFFTEWEATRMPRLLRFAAWLQITRRLTSTSQREELLHVRRRWLCLQREFQAATDSDTQLYDACGHYQPDPVQCNTDAKNLDVLKFVGPQGCGKSTLSRVLYALLQKAKYNPRWVNQDESGNRKKFLASLQEATHTEAGVTHLLIDKMNLDAKLNHDYDNLPLTLTVAWYHPDGKDALYNLCVERVLGRGNRHRTIHVGPNLSPQQRAVEEENIRRFVRMAVRACETPRDPSELVLELDITIPLLEMVRLIWEKLQENGINSLPPIADGEINAAIVLAHRYEALLCKMPKAPLYACIGLHQREQIEKMLLLVPPDFTERQIIQSEFHITTKFFGGEADPVAFVAVAERLGQSVTVMLETVVADEHGVAVTVKRDDALYPCANSIPHITISNRKGVPAKYSNALISEHNYPGLPQHRRVVQLPDGVTVTGLFEFR